MYSLLRIDSRINRHRIRMKEWKNPILFRRPLGDNRFFKKFVNAAPMLASELPELSLGPYYIQSNEKTYIDCSHETASINERI
jgi:hypothetical protein